VSIFRLPRFYPILDTRVLAAKGIQPVEAARAVLDEGAKILQYRHKGIWVQAVFDQAAEIARLSAESGALFVVNDRVDFAKLLGAAVHIGSDDLSPFAARRILGPEPVIGFSTHNGFQLKRASEEAVQYLALGPIFSTASKENPDPVVGIEGLEKWRPLTEKPVVAIGGITLDRAADVLHHGADSVAVISGFLPENGGVDRLQERVKAWIEATDS
jgi:thiamine-phosphate pyrophosphorylase